MGMMLLIPPPHRWGNWRALLLMDRALEAFDGRGTDLEVLPILQIPGEPFGTKGGLVLDRLADALLGFCRQARGLPTRGRPFWDTRQGEALPHPLNSPWTGGFRATALLDLRRAPGGMALAKRRDLLLCLRVKPIVRSFRATWLIF